jgi:hypothetical protein
MLRTHRLAHTLRTHDVPPQPLWSAGLRHGVVVDPAPTNIPKDALLLRHPPAGVRRPTSPSGRVLKLIFSGFRSVRMCMLVRNAPSDCAKNPLPMARTLWMTRMAASPRMSGRPTFQIESQLAEPGSGNCRERPRRFTFHVSRFTPHASRFTPHVSRLTFQNSSSCSRP